MSPESSENIPTNSLHTAYELMGVTSMYDLNRAYTAEDQKLMKEGRWDYENPELLTNRVKSLLENIDPSTLSEEEKEWREEILWFWYHHAISCAIWRYQDRHKAHEYTEKALGHQDSDHPNKITKLLYYLAHDDLASAEKLAETIGADKETAISVIDEYREKPFFT